MTNWIVEQRVQGVNTALHVSFDHRSSLAVAIEGFGDLGGPPRMLLERAVGRLTGVEIDSPRDVLERLRDLMKNGRATGWLRFLAVLAREDAVSACHIGDFRCYLVERNGPVRHTTEHTFAHVADEELPKDEPPDFYRKHHPTAIARSVGASTRYAPEVATWSVRSDFSVYLCNYGYHLGQPHLSYAQVLSKVDISQAPKESEAVFVRLTSC